MSGGRHTAVTVAAVTVAVIAFTGLVAVNPAATQTLFGDDGGPSEPDYEEDEGADDEDVGPDLEYEDVVDEGLQFEEVAAERGLSYRSSLYTWGEAHSGVYVADVNNNGYEDILAVGGDKPVLFVNQDGEFVEQRTFDHSEARAAHFFDYGNDGDRDLLILIREKTPAFYENTGGEFERRDVGFDDALSVPHGAVTADFTGDGTLDVLVYQYGNWRAGKPLTQSQRQELVENHPEVRPTSKTGERNVLYANRDGEFVDISQEAGIHEVDWTHAASGADFTGDGRPDIHVGNDFTRDYLYVNQGGGEFEQRDMGIASDRNAMASTVVDVNGDRHLDLFVTNIWFDHEEMDPGTDSQMAFMPLTKGNNMFVNDGSGEFTDRAEEYGVKRGGWGWSAVFADLTNSGRQDLVHGTTIDSPWKWPDQYRILQTWVRGEEGFAYAPSADIGFEFKEETRGVVATDYDADGAVDIAAATTGGTYDPESRTPYRLYENQRSGDGAVQLFVRNPDGLETNAEVHVELDDGGTVYRVVNSRHDYLSQNSRLVHVGTGGANVERVRVVWPDGTEKRYSGVEAGSRYVITPGGVEHVTTLSGGD